MPRLPGSDFAASVAVGMQTFSQKVIGNVTDFTSRVTNVTNPPPPPSRAAPSGGRSAAVIPAPVPVPAPVVPVPVQVVEDSFAP